MKGQQNIYGYFICTGFVALVPTWIRVETFTLFLLKLKVLRGALDLVIARSNHIILVLIRFV